MGMIEGVGHFETEAIQAREFLRCKNRRRFAHPITPTSGVLGTPVRADRPDPFAVRLRAGSSLRNGGLLRMTT
jgi:hypothetical protein